MLTAAGLRMPTISHQHFRQAPVPRSPAANQESNVSCLRISWLTFKTTCRQKGVFLLYRSRFPSSSWHTVLYTNDNNVGITRVRCSLSKAGSRTWLRKTFGAYIIQRDSRQHCNPAPASRPLKTESGIQNLHKVCQQSPVHESLCPVFDLGRSHSTV